MEQDSKHLELNEVKRNHAATSLSISHSDKELCGL